MCTLASDGQSIGQTQTDPAHLLQSCLMSKDSSQSLSFLTVKKKGTVLALVSEPTGRLCEGAWKGLRDYPACNWPLVVAIGMALRLPPEVFSFHSQAAQPRRNSSDTHSSCFCPFQCEILWEGPQQPAFLQGAFHPVQIPTPR